MQILKFGDISVANAENIKKVVDIVCDAVERDRTILVCSAISECTDTLIKIGNKAADKNTIYMKLIDELQEKHRNIIKKLLPEQKIKATMETCDVLFDSLRSITQGVYLLGELSPTSLDAIQGMGELLSTKIINAKLSSMGITTKWVDSRDIIKTYFAGGKNVVDTTTTFANLEKMVSTNPVISLFILPGFIASDKKGRTTTLGRGGSDYTASLYAVATKARVLEIWTDMPGIMTTNPKIVPNARPITNISYRAALELSHFDSKIIYPPTIQPVVSEGIPIYVKNTFDPSAFGTLIEKNPPVSKDRLVGISNSDNIALLSFEGSGMVGIPGFSSRLFDTFSHEDINIILITQASSVHTMCIAVSEKDADRAKRAADERFSYEISLGKLKPLKVEKGYSIVCLVGDELIGQCGATGRMLAALGRNGIRVRATAQGSSEKNISVIVSSKDANEAIRQIHNEFFTQEAEHIINIFLAGYGNVGKALVDIIAQNSEKTAMRTGKRLRVCGISNSRKFAIDLKGIDLSKAQEVLDNGNSAKNNAYFEVIYGMSLANSVFVDCTASIDIAYKYNTLFKHGYSVIACNKIIFSSSYKLYNKLKDSAVRNGATLRYDTTVGAALPILESISRCVHSGDNIKKVEAVLSGTMNYILSTYRGGEDGVTFSDIVRKAQESQYTEPDPRLDLSGRDVLRKLLILSREAGIPLEEDDVQTSSLLDSEYFKGEVTDFYALLDKNEAIFASAYKEAASRNLRQRFVATLEEDASKKKGYKASIGIQCVNADHPLYSLCGTDNSAIITTDFYPSPLVIQGAGAGARQTASGVFSNILH